MGHHSHISHHHHHHGIHHHRHHGHHMFAHHHSTPVVVSHPVVVERPVYPGAGAALMGAAALGTGMMIGAAAASSRSASAPCVSAQPSTTVVINGAHPMVNPAVAPASVCTMIHRQVRMHNCHWFIRADHCVTTTSDGHHHDTVWTEEEESGLFHYKACNGQYLGVDQHGCPVYVHRSSPHSVFIKEHLSNGCVALKAVSTDRFLSTGLFGRLKTECNHKCDKTWFRMDVLSQQIYYTQPAQPIHMAPPPLQYAQYPGPQYVQYPGAPGYPVESSGIIL